MQFKTIIGQQKAKADFFKSVRDNRVPHALILKGPEGTGKLAFANAIAQFLNCENPQENDSCGVCANCTRISKGIFPDLRFILPIISKKEGGKQLTSDDFFGQFRDHFYKNPYFSFKDWIKVLDGENKQVGIHIREIRELKRKMALKAFEGQYKVVVIWNAEKINTEASNALLKLLEEPPEKTMIIMTVSDPTMLLTTINSRCQRLQLHRVKEEDMVTFLTTKHGIGKEQAAQVAQIAEGSVTRAVELVNETDKSLAELYQRWLRVSFKGDYSDIRDWVETISKENKEFHKLFLGYAIQKIRDALLFSFNMDHLAMVTEEEKKFHRNFSKYINRHGVREINRLMEDSLYYISRNANVQMVLLVLSLRIHSLLSGKVLI